MFNQVTNREVHCCVLKIKIHPNKLDKSELSYDSGSHLLGNEGFTVSVTILSYTFWSNRRIQFSP